jgi:hypothetical protein
MSHVDSSSRLENADRAGMTRRLKSALPTMAPTPREKSPCRTVLMTMELISGKLGPTATTMAPWTATGNP